METTDQTMAEHTRKDIWDRLAAQNEQINAIAMSQASTDAKLHALEDAVERGFKTVGNGLARIADKVNAPSPPPNYMALIVLVIGVLGAFGGYSLLITDPIGQQTSTNRQYIEKLYDDRTELAYLRGKLEGIEERIRDIDNRGSRIWSEKGTFSHDNQ